MPSVAQAMGLPDVRERLMRMNCASIGGTPGHLAIAMVAETADGAKVVKDTGFKVD
jgi:hypothetical protein